MLFVVALGEGAEGGNRGVWVRIGLVEEGTEGVDEGGYVFAACLGFERENE